MSGGVLQTSLMKSKALQEIKLHPKQSLVFWCPKRFRVLNAGRRFGKTTLAIAEMIRTASLIPGSKSIYFAPTISQARDIAWTEMKNQTKNLFWFSTFLIECELENRNLLAHKIMEDNFEHAQ